MRGTATGNLVAGHQVDAVITGHIGRKATKILVQAGVRIWTGASGKVADALKAMEEGRLVDFSAMQKESE